MIIIGLLIGGVLKGAELLENAKVSSLISQVKSVESGTLTFMDSYRSYPGDSTVATATLIGCNAQNFCQNGDGDGWAGDPFVDTAGQNAMNQKFFTQLETIQFWKHLALADMIGGVVAGANPATPEWGTTHPKTAFGGGFEVFHEQGVLYNGSGMTGQILRFSRMGLSATQLDETGYAALSPRVSMKVDKKIDDGDLLKGNMVVWDRDAEGCDGLPSGGYGFDASSDSVSCNLFFKLPK